MKPIRILHVANFNQFKYGAWFMNLDAKLSHGFIKQGHYVYDFSQRDVARSENAFKSKKLGRSRMIEKLFETASNLSPDLVMLGHSEMISIDELMRLRDLCPSARFAMWYCDPLFKEYEDRYEVSLLKDRSRVVDWIFTTSGTDALHSITQGQCGEAHLPNWVLKSCESGRAFEIKGLKNDLIFAGNDYNLSNRKALLEKLVTDSNDIEFAIYQALGRPRIHGQAYYNELSQSLMGLSLSRRFDVPWYSSDRLQQTMGNGVCAISPKTPGLTNLFKNNELIWFDDVSEIFDKIAWHKANQDETRLIAQRGWLAVHEKCSAERIAKFILEKSFELGMSEHYEWDD